MSQECTRADCCVQAEKTENNMVGKLLTILERKDSRFVPEFFQALKETGQEDVIGYLTRNGLYRHTDNYLCMSFACITFSSD